MVSVVCFGVRVSVMFRLMFVHYTFSSVWVAEFSICSHCPLFICNIYLFPVLVLGAGFGF